MFAILYPIDKLFFTFAVQLFHAGVSITFQKSNTKARVLTEKNLRDLEKFLNGGDSKTALEFPVIW